MDAPTPLKLPKKIVYLDNFSAELPQQQLDLLDDFVGGIEKLLGVKAERLSLGDVWDANPPSEAEGQALHDFMKEVLIALTEVILLC